MAATILAAGAGSRMGRIAKAAIHVGGRAVLEWQVSALRDAGIHDISVIVGPYREQMDALMAHCAVQAVQVQAAVHDGTDAPDLVASQHTALRSHVRDRPGSDLLLMPGDLPCVRSSHLHPLQCAWNARHRDIHALVPVVAGVRGHPVLLSWAAVASMAVAAPGDGATRRPCSSWTWTTRPTPRIWTPPKTSSASGDRSRPRFRSADSESAPGAPGVLKVQRRSLRNGCPDHPAGIAHPQLRPPPTSTPSRAGPSWQAVHALRVRPHD